MPTEHIIALLLAERDKLDRAIEALQGSSKRLGRPRRDEAPMVEPNSAAPQERHVSAAARRKMAAAQKKRWAAIKGAK